MEDICELIDDTNLQKLESLGSRVDEAITTDNDNALLILRETPYNFGLMSQGLEVFRVLYHKYPDEGGLLIYFIEGLTSRNQTNEALECLSHVEPSPEKLMLGANLYQQINMMEVAIDRLQEALELEPNDPIIHFTLAEMLYYDGQYLRATSEYETVLETGEYQVNGVDLFSRMADCSLQSGNCSDVTRLCDEINEDGMTSEDYLKKTISYDKNGITQEAIKIMTTLLSKDPDYIRGYLYLQSLYGNEENYPDATETGKEGLRLSQFHKELMYATGCLEIEHDDANEGVLLLKQALEVGNIY